MEVVVSLSQGRTAAAQCGLFTYKSVPAIFEPPCIFKVKEIRIWISWSFNIKMIGCPETSVINYQRTLRNVS